MIIYFISDGKRPTCLYLTILVYLSLLPLQRTRPMELKEENRKLIGIVLFQNTLQMYFYITPNKTMFMSLKRVYFR